MNVIQKYFDDVIGPWQEFSPVGMPEELPDLQGFSVDIPGIVGSLIPGQWSQGQFSGEAIVSIFSSFPPEFRNQIGNIGSVFRDALANMDWSILQSMADLGAQLAAGIIDAISAAIDAISMAMAYWGPIIDAIEIFVKAIMNWIDKGIKDNDENRYKARLEIVDDLFKIGPRGWAGGHYLNRRYERVVRLKKNVYPMAWRPTKGGPLSLDEGVGNFTGDCSQGSGNLSGGTDGSCTGYIELFPLFFPIWSNHAFGNPADSMRRGMERAKEGGAAVWKQLLFMQSELLTNPFVNFQCDGELVRERVTKFRIIFWDLYWRTNDEKTIDDVFDRDSVTGNDHYMTPGGLIGRYRRNQSGQIQMGSTDPGAFPDDTLDGSVRYGSYGSITYENFNSIVSAAGQFFALRAASLRSQAICQEAINTGLLEPQPNADAPGGPVIYIPVREEGLREAIIASAEGSPAPAPMPNVKKMVLSGDIDLPGGPVGGLSAIPPKPQPGRRSSGSSGILLVGAAAAAFVIMKNKR